MDPHSKLLHDLAFIDGLLNIAGGLHPLWLDLLMEAREDIQRELLEIAERNKSTAA
jgi:hypothetical protein